MLICGTALGAHLYTYKITLDVRLHPISSSDCKRELSKYPSLAALDVVVDKDW
jgi:hypothetical protein